MYDSSLGHEFHLQEGFCILTLTLSDPATTGTYLMSSRKNSFVTSELILPTIAPSVQSSAPVTPPVQSSAPVTYLCSQVLL